MQKDEMEKFKKKKTRKSPTNENIKQEAGEVNEEGKKQHEICRLYILDWLILSIEQFHSSNFIMHHSPFIKMYEGFNAAEQEAK